MWKDVTSYSQSDTNRVPKVFELILENNSEILGIKITSNHLYYPDTWLLNCLRLNIKELEMGSTKDLTLKQAQNKAIEICKNKAFNYLKLLGDYQLLNHE